MRKEKGLGLLNQKVSVAAMLCYLLLGLPSLAHGDWHDRLIAHLTFDDPCNLGYDSSGYGHHGTANGGVTYVANGLKGGSVQLDGVDDYISMEASDPCFMTRYNNTDKAFTFSVFFQGSNYTSQQVLLSHRHPCNNEAHFNLYISNGKLYLAFYSDYESVTKIISSDAFLQNGQPYQIFWQRTWGQTGTRLFVNGIERPLFNDIATHGTTYGGLPVYVGAQNGTGSTCDSTPSPHVYFQGILDEVAIWDRILSVAEMETFAEKVFHPIKHFAVANDYAQLQFNNWGVIESLLYQDTNQLNSNYVSTLGKIVLDDGNSYLPKDINLVNPCQYEVTYYDCNAVVTMQIRPVGSHFAFEMVAAENLPANTKEINLFQLFRLHNPQNDRAWAIAADPNALFIHAMSLDPETVVLGTTCKVTKWMGFTPWRGALMTTPKKDYFDSIEDLVVEYELPNPNTPDDKWFRVSNCMRESYMLTPVSATNEVSILNYMKRGKIGQLLLISPLKYSYYNQPRYYTDLNSFYTAMDKFIQDGIKIGFHTFLNRIEPSTTDPMFSLNHIHKERVGTLASDLNCNSTTVQLDPNAEEHTLLAHLANTPYTGEGFYLVIDNEILRCDTYNGTTNTLSISSGGRGYLETGCSSHSTGAVVFLAPYYCGGFYINAQDSNLTIASAQSLAQIINRLDVNLLYSDGAAFIDRPNMDYVTAANYRQKYGMIPYVRVLDANSLLMPMQSGDDGNASYGQYYLGRVASWDGPVFKAKDFTREWKISQCINQQNPYASMISELGWWKFIGSCYDSPDGDPNRWRWYDQDSTTFDEVDYAMTKALAYDVSLGLQMGTNYQAHKQLGNLFDWMGMYNDLIRQDMSFSIVPMTIKEYYKNKDREAKLHHFGNDLNQDWNLVEKTISKAYTAWDAAGNYLMAITNPFGSQKLRLELRPRFDYWPFADAQHTLITNFSDLAQKTFEVSSPQVVYSVTGKQVTVTNNATSRQSCKITLPAAKDLQHKRGLGLSLNRDDSNLRVVEIILELYQSEYGRRCFRGNIAPGAGSRQMTLGDPCSYAPDKYTFPPITMDWHWTYDYRATKGVNLYIVVDPCSSCTLTLNELKGLEEKGTSRLVNPAITLGGQTVTFPVTLSIEPNQPYLLEYDGNYKTYKLYDALYGDMGTYPVAEPNEWVVNSGASTITLASDPNADYAHRAEIQVIVNDDPDNDGIPTNGDANSATYTPRAMAANFYDDNCPNVSNPDQSDIDGDGIGDACDCLADLNNSNRVDLSDFALWSAHWLETDCVPPDYCGGADFDKNGGVDMADLAWFCSDWLYYPH